MLRSAVQWARVIHALNEGWFHASHDKKNESDRTHIVIFTSVFGFANSPSAYYLMGIVRFPFIYFLHCYSLFHSPYDG